MPGDRPCPPRRAGFSAALALALALPLALALALAGCAHAPGPTDGARDARDAPDAPPVVEVSTLGPGWAATKVNTSIFRHHAILTHGNLQFAAYYSPDATVVIAHRDLGSSTWTVFDTGFAGKVRDAHNGISLGISTDGTLHVAYDHHGGRLKYRRSARPLDPTTLGPLEPMTGQRERRVTYPQFVDLADGTLLFLYRDGSSGNGDLCLDRYDDATGTWHAVHHPLIAGSGSHNAYWFRPAVGTDESLQLGFCWRRTPAAQTNSQVGYARSPDGGLTWQNSRGEPYELPITRATAEVVDPVGENHNLSNQDSSEVDSLNRFHAVYRKNDPDGITQYYHLWHDGTRWHTAAVSSFTEGYEITGGGSLKSPLSRGNLFVGENDDVYVLYRDNRQGSRPTVIRLEAPDYERRTETVLCDVDLLQWEPLFDVGRWKRDRVLDLFMQRTDQGNHETVTDEPPTPVQVLEWRAEPGKRSG